MKVFRCFLLIVTFVLPGICTAEGVPKNIFILHMENPRLPANAQISKFGQLAKWQIADQLIPAEATVIGRQPSFWQRYWKYVAGFVVVLLLHKALIVYLLIERRKRKKSEEALREMTKRVIEAGEEERRRIARELHDDFSQRLSLISFQIESISAVRPSGMAKGLNLAEPLDELQSLITDIHGLSHRLHSSKLEHLGLKVAMKELCRQLSEKYEVSISLNTSGLSATPPHDVSLCLYRVAQEALNNVIKHSGAG